MKLLRKNGATSNILRVKLLDSSKTDGSGLAGLTKDSNSLIISTIADVEATATAYTKAATHIEDIATLGTFAAPSASCCRFKEVDATNHPGIYEIQIADARYAVAGAKSLIISILGASNLAQCDIEVQLETPDVNVATITNNAITANAINADALTAAKIADGAIDFATFAADCKAGTGFKTAPASADSGW